MARELIYALLLQLRCQAARRLQVPVLLSGSHKGPELMRLVKAASEIGGQDTQTLWKLICARVGISSAESMLSLDMRGSCGCG